MKKTIFTISIILVSISVKSQNYDQLSNTIAKFEKRVKDNTSNNSLDIKNKKFVLIQTFEDHDERRIVEFNNDGSITLIEVFDDKENGKSSSNIFTGDYVRKNNIVSIRADKLEGEKIGLPLTYTMYLLNAKNIWYLKDIANNQRWIENNNLNRKTNK